MDIDKAKMILKTIPTEFAIENRFVLGIQILANIDPKLDLSVSFRHEQMFIGNFEELVTLMDQGVIKTMAELGWVEDEDSWSFYS